MNQSVSTLSGKIKVKVVFLGDQNVGKSSVIEKYIHNKFQQTSHPTVGIDFLAKNIFHKNKNYRMQLWDTAGQERFRALIPSYLKDAQCALIMFDVTSQLSFDHVHLWLKMYNQNKGGTGATLLIGNKIDLERDRVIEASEARKKAQQLGMYYFEISAKSGDGIQSLFLNLIDIWNEAQTKPQKFNTVKTSQPLQIDEVEEKNQQDKQKQNKKIGETTNRKPNQQSKQSKQQCDEKGNVEQIQNASPKKSVQTPQKNDNTDKKVIRIQENKQKPKQRKGCC